MKRPSWTSRKPSKIASSSLCCTIFTTDFFDAFDGRYLSKSSIRELCEVNVKFVATWLKQWKMNNCKNTYQVLLITLYQICNVQKRKDQPWVELSIIFFRFKNGLSDYLPLETSYNDESACLWKRLKWKKFPFYDDTLSGKKSRGLTLQTACLRKSLKRNKFLW